MNNEILLTLIIITWLLYPIAGASNVAVKVVEGKKPEGSGFSFLPELIVFPVVFYGVAYAIDYFFKPWGGWFVSATCLVMSTSFLVIIIINFCKLPKK